MAKRPDTPFGQLMRDGMHRRSISQTRLGWRISDKNPDAPGFDASAVRMMMSGQRRLDHELVAKIIEALDLDWAEAWARSGLLPPEVTAADLAKLRPDTTDHAQWSAAGKPERRRDRSGDRRNHHDPQPETRSLTTLRDRRRRKPKPNPALAAGVA